MEKYKIIFLVCAHESKESLEDLIQNVFKYNEDSCIIINDGGSENLDELQSKNVIISKRKLQNFQRFDTMIPMHLELYDIMKEKELESDFVVLLSTNQLFIKHGFYDFMNQYDASYFNRPADIGCIEQLKHLSPFNAYYQAIGHDGFVYQSNHDGMFFRFEIFKNIMEFLQNFRNVNMIHHAEEFLYIALLLKTPNIKIVEFGGFNFWKPNWDSLGTQLSTEDVDLFKDKHYYLVKGVNRQLNDPVRELIRSL